MKSCLKLIIILLLAASPICSFGNSSITFFDKKDFLSASFLDSTLIDLSFVEVPNVFTPNRDGFNDVFSVTGTNLLSVVGEVYNRNGQKIASWTGIRGGWNGRTNSGQEVPSGTYFYIIKAIGKDGKNHLKKGSLTLIR